MKPITVRFRDTETDGTEYTDDIDGYLFAPNYAIKYLEEMGGYTVRIDRVKPTDDPAIFEVTDSIPARLGCTASKIDLDGLVKRLGEITLLEFLTELHELSDRFGDGYAFVEAYEKGAL